MQTLQMVVRKDLTVRGKEYKAGTVIGDGRSLKGCLAKDLDQAIQSGLLRIVAVSGKETPEAST
ncbi:MAG TPA: hypothetical protein VMW52_01360 [Phycisphaerae bacterium]|nr:hypothetical protein [Phycisphaerae bacterium]